MIITYSQRYCKYTKQEKDNYIIAVKYIDKVNTHLSRALNRTIDHVKVLI